jgi:protoporphyrinogen/coproporphyrinogen III oxidase
MKVAIVGGGIAGLAAAFKLTHGDGAGIGNSNSNSRSTSASSDSSNDDGSGSSRNGSGSSSSSGSSSGSGGGGRDNVEALSVTLFEASDRLGGIIKTRHEGDCLIEEGPDSFITTKPAALELCRDLGISDRLISTNEKHRRAFVAFAGRLEPIPEGFLMIAPSRFDTFFKSSLFSRQGKLRIACEQFLAKGEAKADESVASFVTRRLGKEALDRIAQPLLAGIYTADADNLSLRATMPKFLEYEQTYGSVIAGLRAEKAKSKITEKSAGARYSAFASLDGGMQVLVDALVMAIGEQNIRLGQKVVSLSRENGGWKISLASGESEVFDHVLLAVPAFVCSQLLSVLDQELAHLLGQIEYASSAVINFLFKREDIQHPLDGFGFVVPAVEKRNILAASFSHVKFAGRCAADKALIRVFMGGALKPQLLEGQSSELIQVAKNELQSLIGTLAEPESVWLKTWVKAMPQYKVGHMALVEEIEQRLIAHSNLHVVGAALRGVGIPDCIESANIVCRKINEFLAKPDYKSG